MFCLSEALLQGVGHALFRGFHSTAFRQAVVAGYAGFGGKRDARRAEAVAMQPGLLIVKEDVLRWEACSLIRTGNAPRRSVPGVDGVHFVHLSLAP